MALVRMDELLKNAEKSKYGVGSFSVLNMEMVMGTIKAAEELHSPIILQIAEGRLSYAPLYFMGPMMMEAAKQAKVPVAVHLDHGLTFETIKQALNLGFTSVMFDGSKLSLQENIKQTNQVIEMAKKYGAVTEAEIGKVGGSEDGTEELELLATSVEDAKVFYEATGVDALAVAIGNAHGVYKSAPALQFGRLKELHEVIKTPLVLHGGSGITVEDFRKCTQLGINKINVMTAVLIKMMDGSKKLFKENPKADYFTNHKCVVQAAYESVSDHIIAFQSNNRV